MAQGDSKRVVLVGGHAATTAIACVEEILKRRRNWELFWIGPQTAIEGKSITALAYRVLPRYGVSSYRIIAGRLTQRWTRWTIPSIFKIPIGFVHAIYLLTRIRAEIILSFGGFAAFPLVVVGWLFRIPVIIHAQTVVVGLANRMSSFFATKIAISRRESYELLPRSKTVLTGNPVIKSIIAIDVKRVLGDPATLYITGGSTGAQRINKAVDGALEKLLCDFIVIHQTGELDYNYFLRRKKKLGKELRDRYEVVSFIDPLEVSKVYQKADILISRAGANTISEILVTRRPSILIPIPWSTFDEQNKNAQMAKKSGIALVLPENDLTPQKLLEKVNQVLKNWKKMVVSCQDTTAKLDIGASARLVDIIEENLT